MFGVSCIVTYYFIVMKMKAIVGAAAAHLSLCALGIFARATEYLEPNVQRHAGLLPASVCKQLIELGEKGTAVIFHVLVI